MEVDLFDNYGIIAKNKTAEVDTYRIQKKSLD